MAQKSLIQREKKRQKLGKKISRDSFILKKRNKKIVIER
nr:ribosomal protein S14 [Tetraena simplex]UYC29902.1 ribosomal protein S14 [Tetraena simplex]